MIAQKRQENQLPKKIQPHTFYLEILTNRFAHKDRQTHKSKYPASALGAISRYEQ